MNNTGKALTATGMGGASALIGIAVGGCVGALLALFTAGTGALHWYKAQPPDWSIITAPCAIVFALVAILIIAAIGALICGIIGGLGSALFTSVWLTGKK